MTELTPRQRDIMRLVLDGKANKEIARTLGLTYSTVANTLYVIYRRLGVTGRTGAALTLIMPPQPLAGCLVFANRESALAALRGER